MNAMNVNAVFSALSTRVEYFAVKHCKDEEDYARTILDASDLPYVESRMQEYLSYLEGGGLPLTMTREGYAIQAPEGYDPDDGSLAHLEMLAAAAITSCLYTWWLSLCGHTPEAEYLDVSTLERQLIEGYTQLVATILESRRPKRARPRRTH